MSEVKPLNVSVLADVKPVDTAKVDEMLKEALAGLNKKIIALDDDPTGVQTVNNVYVYTDWSVPTLEQAFNDGKSISFIPVSYTHLDVYKRQGYEKQISSDGLYDRYCGK